MNQAHGKGNRRTRQAEIWDDDLEWFLVAGAAAMRERGTLGAVVNVLELGGVDQGGVPNTDFYTDAQVGFGAHPMGEVERYRWLSRLWHALPRDVQSVLIACYLAPRSEFRADAGFGAKACDAQPRVEEEKRGGVETKPIGSHGESGPPGAESELGELAGLVFWGHPNPERIAGALLALRGEDKGGRHAMARRMLKAALKAAREAAIDSHKVWRALKGEIRSVRPRKRRDRVMVQPAWARPSEEL